MTAPTVSVIMSVYNGARDVPTAVRSILGQTFRDFELIAINDGSFKDNTRTVLDSLAQDSADPRLRVVHLDKNVGLAAALNLGIGLAKGRYIFRQDHDDISFPTRLEKQIAYLERKPNCALLGSAAEIWVGDTPSGRAHDHPTDNAALQVDLLSNNPFVHTSIAMRRAAIDRVGLYTTHPARQPPEDFELWSRISRGFEVANLSERLVVYREVAQSMSRNGANPFLNRLLLISAENIAHWNGLTTPDTNCHAAACLLHAAHDRVPIDTEIGGVVRVLERAVDAIQAVNPGADLTARKAQLVANARHHFVHARKLPGWLKPLLPIARVLPVSARAKMRISSLLAR